MRKRSGIFGLSEIDATIKNTLGQLPSARESMALVYWPEVVGIPGADSTQPVRVRNGTLTIRTKSSVWSQELTGLKPILIERLNERLGEKLIINIVFKATGLSKKPKEQEEEIGVLAFPDEDEMARIELSEDEVMLMQMSLDKLESVEDEKMRESLRNRVIRDRKIRHWRLEHGWKHCKTCTAIHHDEGAICPVCQLR
ncbi:MAG: DUF721 domain-containing protein [Chthonomonadales bacterium]